MSDCTPRDNVWAAILTIGENHSYFRVRDVEDEMYCENLPSEETIKRVLRAATELGVVYHASGSPYYGITTIPIQ